MNVSGYFYVKPDTRIDNTNIISATLDKRDRYMSDVMYSLYKKDIHDNIKPKGKVAFLYVGGASEHHSHSRNYNKSAESSMPVFSQMGYIASKLARRFEGVEYVNINSNACASSMYSLYEAERLLKEYDSVIIYGEEWAEGSEVLLFESLSIDIVCADGFFVMCLDNGKDGVAEITNTSWNWNPDKSAFGVSKEGYLKALDIHKYSKCDIVKMHGTGTQANNEAENEAVNETFGFSAQRLSIKDEIGHSQGVSTGLELCMMIDEGRWNRTVALASGLGSFYGSCYMELKNV